jgi:hypothetical protein
MTPAVLERSPHIEHTHDDERRPRRRPGEGPTLDDVVSRAWEVLKVELPACCPVCGGELIPGESAAGGRCQSCGSTLS